MKKAVMYGAGNIGRGFIGKVFSDSGYEVCFIDIMQNIIDEMNSKNLYTVRIVSNEGSHDETVKNIRAVHAASQQAIEEISDCDIMATAVGVNILPKIAPVLAKGIIHRMKSGQSLNIILCENQLDADILMRGWIYEHLDQDQKSWADKNLGLIEASIGRMVPIMTPEQKKKDPLLSCVESYADLPVDREAFKGTIPNLNGLIPYSPFGFYIKRKLFIHNMAHCILAYLGAEKGYEFIWQAVENVEIYEITRQAMLCSATALAHEFTFAYRGDILSDLHKHVYDLLLRFGNKLLGDTVARVGGDPIRKLRRNDRLIGAALYCLEHDVNPLPILEGVRAALKYNNLNDITAAELQKDYKEKGLDYILFKYMGLDKNKRLFSLLNSYLQQNL